MVSVAFDIKQFDAVFVFEGADDFKHYIDRRILELKGDAMRSSEVNPVEHLGVSENQLKDPFGRYFCPTRRVRKVRRAGLGFVLSQADVLANVLNPAVDHFV